MNLRIPFKSIKVDRLEGSSYPKLERRGQQDFSILSSKADIESRGQVNNEKKRITIVTKINSWTLSWSYILYLSAFPIA